MQRLLLGLLAAFLIAPPSASGQIQPNPTQPLLPLKEVLNPDGTVNTAGGFSGGLDPSGWRITSSSVSRLVLETAGGAEVPTEFALFQNYPNPFNPATTIKVALPVAGRVTSEIFNILGQRVRSLLNEDRPAGYHTVQWNGTGDVAQHLGSGAYFCRISATTFSGGNAWSDAKKLVLMK